MGKFENAKENKKQVKKYIRLGVVGAVVLLLAVMPMLASRNAEGEASQASILSATVEAKTIDTRIIGGGQLASEASLSVKIPENVKLTEYLVGNGDTVKAGDAIAKVDKISVMTAITQVQETLDYLAEEIADAGDDTASTSVKALAGGTVKVIYAEEGESVQDVMLDHGALAVLSLDDTMAVKIEKESSLDVGDRVIITLPDGTEVDGRVKTNLEGVLTITMEDDGYSVGAEVTVTAGNGEQLGTGELYIFSPWNATAYSGYVDDILVKENDSVYIGRTLFSLEDTGHSAQFQRLIDQRQEYEELMQELFTMYRTETITAPCDGIITGVDEDGAYLLSDNNSDSWFVNLLSFFDNEAAGFRAYAVKVTEVTEEGMTMALDPEVTYLQDLRAISCASAELSAMTESCNYSGDTTIYIQEENGILTEAGKAEPGDVLLAVGDEMQVHWFVALNGGSQNVQAGPEDSAPYLKLLSDSENGDQSGDEQGDDGQDDGGGDTGGDETAEDVVYVVTYIDEENSCVTLQPFGSAGDPVIYYGLTYPDGETLIQIGDKVKFVDGTLQKIVEQNTQTPGTGGAPSGGAASGGGMSAGGTGQTQTFETYSLEKLTVASVTSQEHMTVSITVDELDITSIYVGQAATVSVDALGGEQFAAEITQISNSGENEGGNSKFTVEVTLGKSGDMLPGMYCSAVITLESGENIPCVPVAALDKDGVNSILYTSCDADSGILGDPVVVTIGRSDGENVEVVAGLELGEICYYEYYDTYVGSDEAQQQSGGFNLGAMMGGR